jgi:hypothetical protein
MAKMPIAVRGIDLGKNSLCGRPREDKRVLLRREVCHPYLPRSSLSTLVT